MNRLFSEIRFKVLIIRIIMGIAFAFLLMRFFFPGASLLKTFGLAGLLTFAAYGMEYLHRGQRP